MKTVVTFVCRSALLAAIAGILLVFPSHAHAEDPYVLWAKAWTVAWGPNAVALSRSGTLYVDADRNSFEHNLFGFNSRGQILSTNAHEDFYLGDLMFDGAGNRYLTGTIVTEGTFDTNVVQGFFVAKYGPNDELMWVRSRTPPLAPDWWEFGEALAVDAQGNTLVGGSARGPTSFGSYNFGATEGQRPIFCKYDPAGDLLWARRIEMATIGASDDGWVKDLAVDSSGNVVICGSLREGTAEFEGTTVFPGSTGHSYGGDWFIAKYGPDGALKWVQLGYASCLTVDTQGNIFVGWNWGFDGKSGIAKLSPTGELLWSKNLPGVYMGDRGSLAVAPDGGVVFTGEFEGTAQFDAIRLRASSTTATDFFVAKADADGNLEWAIPGGGTGNDRGYTVHCDFGGNIFLTGTIREKVASFGGHSLVPISTAGLPTLFAAKLSHTPPLRIQSQSGRPTLVWPARATNYVLETSRQAPSESWLAVVANPVTSGTEQSVTLDAVGDTQFFRLRKL
ncbi:MAG: hypothetical protein KJ072_27155 [Verrucomicrobia bacterium]|nr:hypothetical protein [Verrucomicrobiota bacterium]